MKTTWSLCTFIGVVCGYALNTTGNFSSIFPLHQLYTSPTENIINPKTSVQYNNQDIQEPLAAPRSPFTVSNRLSVRKELLIPYRNNSWCKSIGFRVESLFFKSFNNCSICFDHSPAELKGVRLSLPSSCSSKKLFFHNK